MGGLKGNTTGLRLHGNPNGFVRQLRGAQNPASLEKRRSRKLFTDFLHDFYAAKPGELRKLVHRAHKLAMEGHARFLELILDRLEGPVIKESAGAGTTFNFHLSEVDRQRALDSIDNILAMAKTIQVLPEKTDAKPQ